MTIMEIIKTRRTVHLYEPGELRDDIIERLVEAGHYAPNHKLTWPWRFTLVGENGRAAIAARSVEIKSEGRELTDTQIAKIRSKILDPGALIVVSQIRCENEFQSKEDYAAVSCAIQNISLAAHAEGLGTKWSTGGITRDSKTYEVCGIESGDEEIVGFLWLGKPKIVPSIKRPDFERVLRRVQ